MTDDVTKFWDAVRAKWPDPVLPLNKIPLHEQFMLIESINTILTILNNNKGKQ
jgi:hypothetical protein